jgi:transcriptional regulator with XRE-family HTH domain
MGMSQAELATKIRRRHRPTTASYICRIESGEIDPRASTICSLARALRVKPWQLLVRIDESDEFWRGYMDLTAQQKRDVQNHVKYLIYRRGQ